MPNDLDYKEELRNVLEKNICKMDHVLIDADVILDFFYDRKPFSDFSARVLLLCEKGKIKGYTTPVIISNVYYILSRNARHREIIDKIKQLMTILEIFIIDKKLLWKWWTQSLKILKMQFKIILQKTTT